MKQYLVSLFNRVRNPSARKPVAVPVPAVDAATAEAVGQAYRKFGPRVARQVARSIRSSGPSSEGSSRWAMA